MTKRFSRKRRANLTEWLNRLRERDLCLVLALLADDSLVGESGRGSGDGGFIQGGRRLRVHVAVFADLGRRFCKETRSFLRLALDLLESRRLSPLVIELDKEAAIELVMFMIFV